jgi:hypothetical protein
MQGYRGALRALRAIGIPLRPAATRRIEWISLPILDYVMRNFCKTKAAVVAGGRPVNAAPAEMKERADEFRGILRRASFPTPASDVLFAEVGARAGTGTKA